MIFVFFLSETIWGKKEERNKRRTKEKGKKCVGGLQIDLLNILVSITEIWLHNY